MQIRTQSECILQPARARTQTNTHAIAPHEIYASFVESQHIHVPPAHHHCSPKN